MQTVERTAKGSCVGPDNRNLALARYGARTDGETLFFYCKPRFQEETNTCLPLARESGKEVVCFVRERIQRFLDAGANEGSKRSIETTSVTISLDRNLPNITAVDGKLRPLTPSSYKTLETLFEEAGDDVSLEDVYSRTHNGSFSPDGAERTVAVQIKRLRDELGSDDCIESIERYGYRINTPVPEPGQNGEQRESSLTVQTTAARVTLDERLRNKIWVDGVCKTVSPIEYAFVRALMKKNGDYLRYEDIYKEIHKDETYLPSDYFNSLKITAHRIKTKLGNLPLIEKIKEVGYRLDTPVTEPGPDDEQRASVRTLHTNLGRITLDEGKHKVILDGQVIPLSVKEFDYLQAFIKTPNVPLTQTQLYQLAYPKDSPVPTDVTNIVNNAVKKINRKFGHSRKKRFINFNAEKGHMLVAENKEAA